MTEKDSKEIENTENQVNEEEDKVIKLSRKEEKEKAEQIKQQNAELIPGHFWCLVEIKWYESWEKYVEQDDLLEEKDLKFPKPGKIDNSSLMVNGRVKRTLVTGEHFLLVHLALWEFFHSIYGGEPTIKRKVLELGKNKEKLIVVHQKVLYLYSKQNGQVKKRATIRLVVNCTIKDIHDLIERSFKIKNKNKLKLFLLNKDYEKVEELDDPDQTIYESKLEQDDIILWEVEKKKKKKKPKKKSSYNYGYGYSYRSSKPSAKGLTGLSNLGNTCFMNSGLQCLLNTVPLRDVFLKKLWVRDLNTTNPIGMKGELARVFAELVSTYWSGNHSVISPRDVKYVIGRFASQFMGFAQQDSQELISFLLDGLHEDLNRIIDKPYIEDIDGTNCKDLEKLAKQTWYNYKRRNDSYVVDLFQGQLRNRLICPECNTESYKFDPLMYLTVPIPTARDLHLNITVIPYDRSTQPLKEYYIKSRKSDGIDGVLSKLSNYCGIEESTLHLTEIYKEKIYKEFQSLYSMDEVKSVDLFVAYEIPKYDRDEEVEIPIYFTYLKGRTILKFSLPSKIVLPLGKMDADKFKEKVSEKVSQLCPNLKSICEEHSKDETFEIESSEEEVQVRESYWSTKTVKKPLPKETIIELFKQYGFKINEFNPEFQIAITKESSSYKSNTSLLDLEEPVKIKKKMAIEIRFNPNLTKKDPEFIEGFSKVEKHESVTQSGSSKKKSKMGVSLSDCLDAFVEEEKLNKNNKWYCPVCKDHVQAKKKFDIWRLPDILVINLKRFSPGRWYRNKVSTFVNFPTFIDLEKYILGPKDPKGYKYENYAVSNHFGGVGGGHYTAYGKNHTTGNWYGYNDSSVSSISSPDSAKTDAAYVLFYRRIYDEENSENSSENEQQKENQNEKQNEKQNENENENEDMNEEMNEDMNEDMDEEENEN
ncbi:ubiquitin carboxyl-terminal hydrolase 11 [Anaeramoeba flamelloides]|uniref:ubiquitinyl hydrolase 1 n=1 Tax=Anaeramoeba flamelloides TaxID=1746091 RepID=A0ABQ8YPT6_9EUKA|nr:ubiquitin carboxyl-terminal hydrolase 11 [Anaeramoeba flamelloides]